VAAVFVTVSVETRYVSKYMSLFVCPDGCKKTAVVFDEAIASFDIINCQSVQAQVLFGFVSSCI